MQPTLLLCSLGDGMRARACVCVCVCVCAGSMPCGAVPCAVSMRVGAVCHAVCRAMRRGMVVCAVASARACATLCVVCSAVRCGAEPCYAVWCRGPCYVHSVCRVPCRTVCHAPCAVSWRVRRRVPCAMPCALLCVMLRAVPCAMPYLGCGPMPCRMVLSHVWCSWCIIVTRPWITATATSQLELRHVCCLRRPFLRPFNPGNCQQVRPPPSAANCACD